MKKANHETVRIRASSLPELFDCSFRWAVKHLDITDQYEYLPPSPPQVIGTAWHAGTSWYDEKILDGESPSSDDAADEAVAVLQDEQDVAWTPDVNRRKAESTVRVMTAKYAEQVSPTQNFVSVERPLQELTIEAENGLEITFTGQLDREYKVPGLEGAGVADLKSGRGVVDSEGKVNITRHIAQLGTYELLSRMADQDSIVSIVHAPRIIAMDSGKNHPVATPDMPDAYGILVGDDETPGLIDMAAKIIKEGVFVGNPMSMFCREKSCPAYNFCPWINRSRK